MKRAKTPKSTKRHAPIRVGFAECMFIRGTQIVNNYKFCGRNMHGRFVPRDHVGRP